MCTVLRNIRRNAYHLTSREVAEAAVIELQVECLTENGAEIEEVDVKEIVEVLAEMIGNTSANEAVLHTIEPRKEEGAHATITYVFRVPARSGQPAL